MLTSVVAVVSIVAFVLPGFVALRVSAGRRAHPATIGDLELILRALGYALLIHLVFIATGWTPSLANRLTHSPDWGRLRWELIAFAIAVLGLAVILGATLGVALRRLALSPPEQGWRNVVFHAIGGQDSRDAFDYVFERRKRETNDDFIVLVRTDERDVEKHALHVGRYGAKSYFGLTPRPHDLYLEEMWTWDENGELVRQRTPHGAWFRAESIKDLYFRELPRDENTISRTPSLGATPAEVAETPARDTHHAAPAETVGNSYEVLSSEYTWELEGESGSDARVTRRFTIRSLRDDLTTISEWTGSGGMEASYEASPGKVLEFLHEGPGRRAVISLGRVLRRGETMTVETRRRLVGAFTEPSEFIEVALSAGLREVTVCVVFPVFRRPSQVRVRRSTTGDWTVGPLTERDDGRLEARVHVIDPSPDERISVLWDW